MAGRGRGRGQVIRPALGQTGGSARAPGLPNPGPHVATVGVKRTGFGRGGHATEVYTNHYEVTLPQGIIYHYDGTPILYISL